MNIKWAAVILLSAIGTGRMEAAEKIQVDVYIQQDDWHRPLKYSERLASEIFGRSDVRVIWHAGELPVAPCTGRRCIGIRWWSAPLFRFLPPP